MEETIMRKWFIILLTMLLAFTACRQETVLPSEGDVVNGTNICLNLNLQHPDVATKGIKSGWENGDKVFIFLSGCTTGYCTTTYNGTGWSTGIVGAVTIGSTKILHAVYLPYGNDATPTFSQNKWTFNKATDTYYFYASNVPYTVETVGTEQVITASVQMVKPSTYVQFYVPLASATGTVQFACNALCPAGFASLSSDGTVTENIGTAGQPVTGYADTLAGEEGYYVSGIPVTTASETADYYFAIKKGDDYSHYYKNRNALVANHAYQLPAYSAWPRVGGSRHVIVASGNWMTMNEGADNPWDLGELKDDSFVPLSGESIPGDTDWGNLMDSEKATWMPMDIWGSHGSLVLSVSAPNKYLYIPWGDLVTNYWMTNFANSFQIADNGTTLTIPDPAFSPGSAYVRTVKNANYFRIKAKEDETEMTFKYKDGTVQFSIDYGEEWTNYDGRTFKLDAGDEVWFKGNRTNCNCSGNTQLFNANRVCYIAGNIASLLANPTSLTANAFRSAFSYGNLSDSNAENLEKNLPAASGTVDWVDIDPDDPLILPATTAANCYLEMFMGCTSLSSAPELPATELADKCYLRMFYNCPSLTSIPVFASDVTMSGTSNRRRYCFQMFQGCTGITRLEGSLFGETTVLKANCFEDMFANCTGLIYISPGFLPSTQLAAHCYRGMFQNTRFPTAPELLATTLVTECYRYMFNGCTQLTKIICLATTNIGNGYTTNWVGGSIPNNANCKFVKAPSASWPSGANGVLNKWTIEDYSE